MCFCVLDELWVQVRLNCINVKCKCAHMGSGDSRFVTFEDSGTFFLLCICTEHMPFVHVTTHFPYSNVMFTVE